MTRSAPSKYALYNGKLSYGTAPPYGYNLAGLDIAVFRGHVPGREDIREEHHLLVGQMVRNLDRTYVSIGRLCAISSLPCQPLQHIP